MQRNIIVIDEAKCNGCGQCAQGCPEGAIQMVNGKAKLVSENYCDGLGACVGHCPVDAIKVVKKDVENYDERLVMEKSIIPQGSQMINAHLEHLKEHAQHEYLAIALETLKAKGFDMSEFIQSVIPAKTPCGCPGSQMRELKPSVTPGVTGRSELSQWPIQLHLVNPTAPYFNNSDLLISADCAPYAYANYHQKFLKGKKVITLCPKLDNSQDVYVEKLTEILKHNNIKSIATVRMEVPCCAGTTQIVEEAISRSGKRLVLKEFVISIDGELM
ncbi:MAG: 4Fe-4S binding protein [Candidatus Omnitrophica bacterium]|nr:4Fe-4S binding protein [Candidatus Omnitrophota bacterium]